MRASDDDLYPQYDVVTIWLHWIVAGAVALQWLDAQMIDWFPAGLLRVDVRSMHMLGGWILTLTLCYRIWWRRRRGVHLPGVGSAAVARLSSATHVTLYLVLAAVLGLGIASSLIRGDDVFGLFHLPMLAARNAPVRHRITDIHSLAANLLLVLAGLHAATGLAHHFLRRDGVLRRMGFSRV